MTKIRTYNANVFIVHLLLIISLYDGVTLPQIITYISGGAPFLLNTQMMHLHAQDHLEKIYDVL